MRATQSPKIDVCATSRATFNETCPRGCLAHKEQCARWRSFLTTIESAGFHGPEAARSEYYVEVPRAGEGQDTYGLVNSKGPSCVGSYAWVQGTLASLSHVTNLTR